MFEGFLGGLFDLNHDGEMDSFERTMDFMAFEVLTSEDDEIESDEDELMSDLETAGLNYDELEFMDEDERREILEDAGLDPDDYGF